MELIVASRQRVTTGIRVTVPYIVISMRDSGSPRPRIPHPRQCQGICFLAFDDVDPQDWDNLPPRLQPMRPKHARRIWQFVQAQEAPIQAIVVHCEMGMSRSPAVAAALAVAFAQDDERFFMEYQPNRHVYRLMAAAIHGALEPALTPDMRACQQPD